VIRLLPPLPVLVGLWLLHSACASAAASPALTSSSSSAAQAERILWLAGQLLSQGNAYEAVTEYKRVLHHFPEEIDSADVYRNLAMASFELGESEDAIGYARESVREERDPTRRLERRLDLAALQIGCGYPGSAMVELVPMTSGSTPADVADEARLLLVVAHIHQFQWDAARDAFQECEGVSLQGTTEHQDAVVARVDSLLFQLASEGRKRPETAVLLSTIVPGAGQLYAGHPLEALHAFCLSVACAYWTYVTAANGSLLEAAVGPFPWFLRYYGGNRYWAAERVREDAAERDLLAAERLMALIQGSAGQPSASAQDVP